LRWVFVGTGQFLDITDLTDTQRQTMYALRDGTGSTPATTGLPLTRNALTPVTNLLTGAALTVNAAGWYVDLTGSAGGNNGGTERIVVTPSTATGLSVVAWVTLIPSSDPCSLQGSLYAVNYTGASVLLNNGAPVTSTTTTAAALTSVQLVKNPNGTVGVIAGDTAGNNKRKPINAPPSQPLIKRVNWREVMN
jgi:type IV pilus assembly protein PilY1